MLFLYLTSNLHVHVSAQHNVLALEVPVNHAEGVAICDGSRHLPEDVPSFRLWECAARVDVVQEIPVLRELHEKVAVLVRLEEAVQVDDVRVVDGADDVDLARKELGEVVLGGSLLVQDFDGNLQGRRWERDQ